MTAEIFLIGFGIIISLEAWLNKQANANPLVVKTLLYIGVFSIVIAGIIEALKWKEVLYA